MAQQLFANNAAAVLAGSINDTDLSITLDDASAFPSPTGGDTFKATLVEITSGVETDWEIVTCSARSGNTITISARGAESTTARAWTAGAVVEVRWTAGSADAVAQTAAPNTFGSTQKFTRIGETVAAVTGTTPALGGGNATIFTWALPGASTPTSGLADGESCTVDITPTTHSINWVANFNVGDAGAPPLTNGKVTRVFLQRIGSVTSVDFVRQY